jgi:hypothetical protein
MALLQSVLVAGRVIPWQRSWMGRAARVVLTFARRTSPVAMGVSASPCHDCSTRGDGLACAASSLDLRMAHGGTASSSASSVATSCATIRATSSPRTPSWRIRMVDGCRGAAVVKGACKSASSVTYPGSGQRLRSDAPAHAPPIELFRRRLTDHLDHVDCPAGLREKRDRLLYLIDEFPPSAGCRSSSARPPSLLDTASSACFP